jgi:hypothetical protein
MDFQIQPQHETKKQWQNHGSEKTSNDAGISAMRMYGIIKKHPEVISKEDTSSRL